MTSADIETNGLSLYAVWVKSAGTLQNWSGCPGLSQGSVTALTDERDNNTYAVAKLADGKCWMIENLRLENTALHNSDGTLAQGYNPSFIGLADPESSNIDGNKVANSLYSTDGSTAAPAITGDLTGERFPRYNNNNTNSRQSSSSYSIKNNTYSYGNYYTWHAAIADTSHYTSGDHNTTSICPSGWRIPTGENAGEFYALNNAVNSGAADSVASNNMRSYPNNFIHSGFFGGSSAYNRGDWGYYWSSTAGYGKSSGLYLSNSAIYYSYPNNMSYSYAVRCILSP